MRLINNIPIRILQVNGLQNPPQNKLNYLAISVLPFILFQVVMGQLQTACYYCKCIQLYRAILPSTLTVNMICLSCFIFKVNGHKIGSFAYHFNLCSLTVQLRKLVYFKPSINSRFPYQGTPGYYVHKHKGSAE